MLSYVHKLVSVTSSTDHTICNPGSWPDQSCCPMQWSGGAGKGGMTCTTCPHLGCQHSYLQQGVMPCPECEQGTVVRSTLCPAACLRTHQSAETTAVFRRQDVLGVGSVWRSVIYCWLLMSGVYC